MNLFTEILILTLVYLSFSWLNTYIIFRDIDRDYLESDEFNILVFSVLLGPIAIFLGISIFFIFNISSKLYDLLIKINVHKSFLNPKRVATYISQREKAFRYWIK